MTVGADLCVGPDAAMIARFRGGFGTRPYDKTESLWENCRGRRPRRPFHVPRGSGYEPMRLSISTDNDCLRGKRAEGSFPLILYL